MRSQAEPQGLEAKDREFRTVLVDTSLLIEQQKRERHATPVRYALAAYRFQGASSYSKLEFKRAWVQRLGYLHWVCRKPDIESIVDVQDWIERKLTHTGHQRRLHTCLAQLNRFFDLDNNVITEFAALVRLRAHCKHAVLGAAEAMKEMITGEFKGSGCVRAEEPARELPDGALDVSIARCKPSDIQCTIHHLFENQKMVFGAIADHVDSSDKASGELKTMAKHIRVAQDDPTHLCDDRYCRKLADAIIAVDGRKMDVFAANNDKEWLTLASVMNKQLLNPVRNRQTDGSAR